MTIALVLLALAALGGVTMATMRLRGAERPPTALALVHGAAAAAGLIALIVAVMLSVTSIAAIDLVYRGSEPPTGTGRVLHVAALVLVAAGLGAGGWLGGHLVFHHRVGVDPRPDERS